MIMNMVGGGGGSQAYGFLTVNYPEGATLTCTNVSGYKDISTTQRLYYVNEPSSGTSISCVATISQTGQTSKSSDPVSFTAEGQSQTVTLAFELFLDITDESLWGTLSTLTACWKYDSSIPAIYRNDTTGGNPGGYLETINTHGYTTLEVVGRASSSRTCKFGIYESSSGAWVNNLLAYASVTGASYATVTVDISAYEGQDVFFGASVSSSSGIQTYIKSVRFY